MSIKKQGETTPQGQGSTYPMLANMQLAVDSVRAESPPTPSLIEIITHFGKWDMNPVEAIRFQLLYNRKGNSIRSPKWQIAANWYIFGLKNPIEDV